MDTVLIWLERDLRLGDNPVLDAARREFDRLLPVFLWNNALATETGAAARWWLHHSLAALERRLAAAGSRLLIQHGEPAPALVVLAQQSGARSVWWNDRTEPGAAARADQVRAVLEAQGIATRVFTPDLLHAPDTLRAGTGHPYRVFTAFWRASLREATAPPPLPTPHRLPPVPEQLDSVPLESLRLRPPTPWDTGLAETWQPGEREAMRRLRAFSQTGLAHYPERRERPAETGTSRLSPHLHFGEVSPRQVVHAVRGAVEKTETPGVHTGADAFVRQLYWREFAHYLLHNNPKSPEHPLDRRFEQFPWRDDPEALSAWRRGETGIPLVDAGMRELWHTGWMHNRVRMVVASFLTKNLLIPWQKGAAWFLDTLVDADLANNTLGWQWTAGCGADAAPFFRVFNPVAQAQRYDPNGAYLRRWLPELAGLPSRWLPQPWSAPESVARGAGIRLGETYPHPIVDLQMSRERALRAFERMRRQSKKKR